MIRPNIQAKVLEFTSASKANQRYASFDYCYNYFLTTEDLKKDIEKSCLTLGFYLASWGMFRGSSFLLKRAQNTLNQLLTYISSLDRSVWKIDVDDYSEQNIDTIIHIYNEIKGSLIDDRKADLTLITKVLLGVFGFVPAFDSFFTAAFRDISDGECGFRRVNRNSLSVIKKFYEVNQRAIKEMPDRMRG